MRKFFLNITLIEVNIFAKLSKNKLKFSKLWKS